MIIVCLKINKVIKKCLISRDAFLNHYMIKEKTKKKEFVRRILDQAILYS